MRDEQRRAFVDIAGAELAGLRKFAYEAWTYVGPNLIVETDVSEQDQ